MIVVYVCWQGIKVQQAANFAARVNGQEKVSGGTSKPEIELENKGPGNQDEDISKTCFSQATQKYDQACLSQLPNSLGNTAGAPRSVYHRYAGAVRQMFTSSERNKLWVPPPEYGNYSDQVKVIRKIDFSRIEIFGWKPPSVVLEAKAYGGEDPGMYGLPRWKSFWKKMSRVQNTNGSFGGPQEAALDYDASRPSD